MSTRPASPPPVARWPFVLGDVLCFSLAAIALLFADSPPGIGTMVIVFLCVTIGIGLFVTPYLKDHEDRLRIAEAQTRDHIEAQLRRLTQTTEQLGNAISRSQSTEEQAGQALGTIEELSEKLNTQAEELAQALARSHEREIATLKADLDRLRHERDERLAALDQRLDTVTSQLSEQQIATKKATAATGKALEEVKERMVALAARLDELVPSGSVGATVAPDPKPPAPPFGPPTRPIPESTDSAATTTPSASRSSPPPAAPAADVSDKSTAPGSKPAESGHEPSAGSTEPVASAKPTVITAAAPRTRTRRAPAEVVAHPPSRISTKNQPMDLPFLDIIEAQPIVHRDTGGTASTLVATAYIGIGNKLYVRGDGPGLSWDQGVPMQFLAIGKWGWTSPEAAEPIICRIYRNDETPMLDENIVIAPGSKAEITPRF